MDLCKSTTCFGCSSTVRIQSGNYVKNALVKAYLADTDAAKTAGPPRFGRMPRCPLVKFRGQGAMSAAGAIGGSAQAVDDLNSLT